MLEACPRCDFVLWRDPKVATAVIVESGEGIVLGRRAIEPGRGLWCFPGGFVNDDEHPEAAALRECIEEIGVAVDEMSLLGVFHIGKQGAPSMIGIAYRGRLAEGVLPAAGPEMLEVGVFDTGSLPPLAFPSHREILARYLTSRATPVASPPRRAGAKAPRGTQPSPAPISHRPPRKR